MLVINQINPFNLSNEKYFDITKKSVYIHSYALVRQRKFICKVDELMDELTWSTCPSPFGPKVRYVALLPHRKQESASAVSTWLPPTGHNVK